MARWERITQVLREPYRRKAGALAARVRELEAVGLIYGVITPRLRARLQRRLSGATDSQAFLIETVGGIETLKSLALEAPLQHRWEEHVAAQTEAAFQADRLSQTTTAVVMLLNRLLTGLTLWWGAHQVIAGTLTAGQLIGFNMLAGRVMGPAQRLAMVWQQLQQARLSVTRVGEILDTPVEPARASEGARLDHDLQVATAEAARLRTLLAALPAPAEGAAGPEPPAWEVPAGTPAAVAQSQRRLLDSQWRRLAGQLEAAERERARLAAQLEATRAQQAKVLAVLAVLRQRVEIRAVLEAQALGTKANLLELRQSLVEHEQEAQVLRAQERLGLVDQAAAEARRRQVAEEARATLSAELAEAEARRAALEPERLKAGRREERRTLIAPVSGTVVDLAVHTVGGVVREAEPLLRIVPAGEGLEVEALVRSRDIGFVGPGQRAEVKVDAFPYTRYGKLAGRVLGRPADASAAGPGADPSQAVYRVRVGLERASVVVDGAATALTPGMTVTVDIRTGRRRVLEFLLDPLLRYRAESLRER